MNICFTNPTKKLHLEIRELSQYLVSRGHKVVVLTPKMPGEDDLRYLGSVQVIVYPSIFLPKIRYTIPFFLRQFMILREVTKREQIDIIHLWTYFYPAVWIPLFYAKIYNIPVLLSMGSFPGISWRYGSKFVDFVAKVYTKTVGKIILRHCDKVLPWNPMIMGIAKEIGINEDKLLLNPLGPPDFDRFSLMSNTTDTTMVRKSLGIYGDEAMILNVGRLVPVKGIETLIKITEKLLKDGFKAKTVIVGDGPGPYRKKYEKMAKSINENIIFTGFRRDVPELMSACDVFVLPSLGEELCYALLEAAACSKPIVASNVGGLPAVIIHGETGFLAEPNDVDSFTYYVELLLTDRELSREFSRKNHEHIKANFSWDRFIKKNEDIYEQVLEVKRWQVRK
jgi:glycosyltransferase involved in cell wall biosynthesis